MKEFAITCPTSDGMAHSTANANFFISTQYTDSGNIHDTLEDIGARGLFPILFQFVGT